MDGNAPTIVTNTTARSLAWNHTIARGTQATKGVICSATISGRTLRPAKSLSASPTPIAVPITIAAANEKASRMSDFSAARGIEPSEMPWTVARQTSIGEGIAADDVAAATIAQTTTNPARPASGAPNSLAAHLARHTLAHLPHDQLVDLVDHASDQDVVERARARRVDPNLLQQPARRRRH